MKFALFSALAWGLPLVCLARDHHSDWPVRDQENIQQTLSLSQAPMRLVIDNIEGYVHVTGVLGTQVRIKAHKTIRAESDADLQQARAEVKLDITEKPGTVSAYYDAVWRCENKGPACHGNERLRLQRMGGRRFYSVVYDIDVEVPAAARLYISAVNNGDVHVDKVKGDYEVHAINGGIQMSGIMGSGQVHTVNGPVSVHFARNPAANCSFKSVNGPLDMWFQSPLSADLLFKTFNGQIYSGFDIAARAVPASALVERRDGKFVYHGNGSTAGRAGSGGPELSFDTLNGSIRLHREQ